eukprot:scaffold48_cov311-Pinguiococcus_pyrenoidosus.AAC.180
MVVHLGEGHRLSLAAVYMVWRRGAALASECLPRQINSGTGRPAIPCAHLELGFHANPALGPPWQWTRASCWTCGRGSHRARRARSPRLRSLDDCISLGDRQNHCPRSSPPRIYIHTDIHTRIAVSTSPQLRLRASCCTVARAACPRAPAASPGTWCARNPHLLSRVRRWGARRQFCRWLSISSFRTTCRARSVFGVSSSPFVSVPAQ